VTFSATLEELPMITMDWGVVKFFFGAVRLFCNWLMAA